MIRRTEIQPLDHEESAIQEPPLEAKLGINSDQALSFNIFKRIRCS